MVRIYGDFDAFWRFRGLKNKAKQSQIVSFSVHCSEFSVKSRERSLKKQTQSRLAPRFTLGVETTSPALRAGMEKRDSVDSGGP